MNTLQRILFSTATSLLSSVAASQCSTAGTTPYWEVTWAGCLASGNHQASNDPVIGNTVVLTTDSLPPTALLVATVLLLPPGTLGTPTTNLFGFPLLPGCSNYLPNAVDFILQPVVAGTAFAPLTIPNDPFWVDKVLHSQSFVIHWDFTFTATNALCLHIGQ